jgi:hypothetical protein
MSENNPTSAVEGGDDRVAVTKAGSLLGRVICTDTDLTYLVTEAIPS